MSADDAPDDGTGRAYDHRLMRRLLPFLRPYRSQVVLAMVITLMQRKIPSALPEKLRIWNWLPLWMRSLEPLDNVILRVADLASICKCKKKATLNTVASASGISNKGFE